MVDPRQAFADNPRVPCTIELTHRAVGRPWGGEPEWEEGDERARRGSRQGVRPRPHRAAHGGDRHRRGRRRDVRADRRPRDARPLVGSALVAERVVVPLAHRQRRPRARLRDDRRRRRGRWSAQPRVPLRRGPLRRRPLGARSAVSTSRPTTTTSATTGPSHAAVRTDDHTYEIDGTVWSNIPLRNRKQAPTGEWLMTRIAEGMTTWTLRRGHRLGPRRVPRPGRRRRAGRQSRRDVTGPRGTRPVRWGSRPWNTSTTRRDP